MFLQEIKVVDFTHVQAGPTCTAMLGDLGANVIKVESFAGDQFRQPLEGANFWNFNRNKRAIAINLKTDEGKEIALRLVQKADVFVENFLPGSLERLGLDYESISKVNPKIIYCSISGYGQEGPFRDRPAYEPVLQAMSGIMECTGEKGRPPVRVRPAMIDFCTAANAAFAIVASLLNREKTGKGLRIDMALLDVAIFAMAPYVTQFKKKGELPERSGSAQPWAGPSQNFETKDGLIHIVAGTDHMFNNLCLALNRSDLANNPLYITRESRAKYRDELVEAINQETRKYSKWELEEILLKADVACSVVRNIGEIIQEAHVKEKGIFEENEIPNMGTITTVRTPAAVALGFPVNVGLRAPMLGEHTEEILTEIGYTQQEIQKLLDEGIVLQYQSKFPYF